MRLIPLKHLAWVNPEGLPENTPLDFEFDYVDISSVEHGRGVISTERVSFGEAPTRARRLIRTGDVLISTVRTYLKAVASVGTDLNGQICSTGFAVLRAGPEIDERFLYYIVTSRAFVEEVVARSEGVSYPAISASDLVRIKVPLPRLEDQRRLAVSLDAECDRLSRLGPVVEDVNGALLGEFGRLLSEYREALINEAVWGSAKMQRPSAGVVAASTP